MSERQVKKMEKEIVPVFKDFEKKGLNSRQIQKVIGVSN